MTSEMKRKLNSTFKKLFNRHRELDQKIKIKDSIMHLGIQSAEDGPIEAKVAQKIGYTRYDFHIL